MIAEPTTATKRRSPPRVGRRRMTRVPELKTRNLIWLLAKNAGLTIEEIAAAQGVGASTVRCGIKDSLTSRTPTPNGDDDDQGGADDDQRGEPPRHATLYEARARRLRRRPSDYC